MATIIAPVAGYTGTVGRVHFLDGAGHTDDPSALRYFQRAGYEIHPDTALAAAPVEQTPPVHIDVERTIDEHEQLTDVDAHDETEPAAPSTVEMPRSTASKAEWFEYLDTAHPGHGLTLECTKRQMIDAAAAIT